MKIKLAQYKPILGDFEKNLKRVMELIEEGIKDKADLIVFPELALTGYLLEDLAFTAAVKNLPVELLHASKKISIIIGAVELAADRYVYNSAFYLEEGEVKHIHRKVYLPTYGMFDEARYFRAGNSIRAFDTKFGRMGILICEDMWHQGSSFILAQDGAEQIFVLTNSPARGFGQELSIEGEWNSLLHSSAIADTVFVTMVNRAGVEDGVTFWGGSRVFAPTGEMICRAENFQEQCMTVEIDRRMIDRVRFSGGVGKNENLPLMIKELTRIWEGNR